MYNCYYQQLKYLDGIHQFKSFNDVILIAFAQLLLMYTVLLATLQTLLSSFFIPVILTNDFKIIYFNLGMTFLNGLF